MEYTGVFAVACEHALIESMVNLISVRSKPDILIRTETDGIAIRFGFIDKAVFRAFELTNYD